MKYSYLPDKLEVLNRKFSILEKENTTLKKENLHLKKENAYLSCRRREKHHRKLYKRKPLGRSKSV